jgi:hypothetical protein
VIPLARKVWKRIFAAVPAAMACHLPFGRCAVADLDRCQPLQIVTKLADCEVACALAVDHRLVRGGAIDLCFCLGLSVLTGCLVAMAPCPNPHHPVAMLAPPQARHSQVRGAALRRPLTQTQCSLRRQRRVNVRR